MGSITLVGVCVLVAIAIAIMIQRKKQSSREDVIDSVISRNDDATSTDTVYDKCRKYVDDKTVDKMHNLIGAFLLAYKDSYKYSTCHTAIRDMYKLKKKMHRQAMEVRYRLPQDGPLLDALVTANENLSYLTTERIQEAEKRCKLNLGFLPLGVQNYATHFRAFNDVLDARTFTL